MFRLLLRVHKAGFLMATLFGLIVLLLQIFGYSAVAGQTDAARRTFALQIQPLALQLSYLVPLPNRLDTLGGYLVWRAYGTVAVGFAVWALLAAAGVVRGEEDRGVLETWLAAGVGRFRWIVARFITFALALALSVAICQLAVLVSSKAVGLPLSVRSLVGEGSALLALSMAWFGITLLLAQQFPGQRRTLGAGVVVLVLLFFANSLDRTNSAFDGVARISPFHLFDQTTSMIPGGHLDGASTLFLALVGVVGAMVAGIAFALRDIRAPLFQFPVRVRAAARTPARNPSLRVPVIRQLWLWRWSLLGWIIGAGLLAALMISLTDSVANLIRQNPVMGLLFKASHTDPVTSTLNFTWFGMGALALAILAVIRTLNWAEDDASGRLELVLAQPVSRWAVVLERAIELGCGVILIVALGSVAMFLAATARGIHLDSAKALVATALLLPLALSFGAAGAALSSWRPRFAVGCLAIFAVAEWFLQQFAPIFRWPEWLVNLSIFQLYGSPLVNPIFWNGLWAMLAITLGGFLVAMLAMRWREVGR